MMGVRERIRASTSLRLRNSHGPRVNARWLAYAAWCRLRSTPSFTADQAATAARLRRRGLVVAGSSNPGTLPQQVRRRFDDVAQIDGLSALPKPYSALAPLIHEHLRDHGGVVEAFYGAHFRVSWIDIQRITPGTQPPGSSFCWHTDDTPPGVLKLFIYLTDTTRDTGAFRALDYAASDAALSRGMLASASPGAARVAAQRFVDEAAAAGAIVLEGGPGTVLLFDNNLIHKGTLPLRDDRIHVAMELMPFWRAPTVDDVARACVANIDGYFPPDPFALLRERP